MVLICTSVMTNGFGEISIQTFCPFKNIKYLNISLHGFTGCSLRQLSLGWNHVSVALVVRPPRLWVESQVMASSFEMEEAAFMISESLLVFFLPCLGRISGLTL